MIFTTITCANHLPLAMVLGKSLKLHHPNSKIVLCLVEEKILPAIQDSPYFDEIVLAKDLGIPDFYKFIFKYNIYEGCCALKPYLLRFLLNGNKKEETFIYLDSDIKVYSPLEELQHLLTQYSIVITPHRLTHQENPHAIWAEITNLKDGVFNGGMIGIKRDAETFEFLNWWANRVYNFCYIEPDYGLFLDQKWLDLIPCFFDNYKVLKHEGYNFASWNLSQRRIMKTKDNQYVINGNPLRFIHFSGLGKWFDDNLNKYITNKNDILITLKDEYIKEIETFGYHTLKDCPWCYNYFNSGEFIDSKTKSIYRDSEELQNRIPYPLQQSNRAIVNYSNRRNISPLVSVITAVFNGEEFLMEAINSVLSQSYNEFEYIIVNDGSTDNTINVLKAITDHRVKVINLEKNMGAAYCLNLGIKKAKGKWIAIQDADDRSDAERLKEQLKYVQSLPDVIAAGSFVKCFSDSLVEDQLNGVNIYFNSLESGEELAKNRFFQIPFCHGTVFFSKKAFQQAGGYNPNYRIAYDWDLWMRLFQVGSIHKINKVLYNYRVDKGSLSFQKWDNTYYEIIKLNMNYINEIYAKNSIQPRFLVLGSDRACNNFKDALRHNGCKLSMKFDDYSALSNPKFSFNKKKTNGIIILDDQVREGLIQNLEKKGLKLNHNLFILHHGIHGLIESGAI
ncbi:glycosyltransferase [Neobacillus sp. NPDC058068]|uniref:glycosyltransferase n=1 Tax=Neobacillus sp. NPDC058068 TaxID=3346325 RepID=UPI0036D9ACBA